MIAHDVWYTAVMVNRLAGACLGCNLLATATQIVYLKA